MATDPADNNVTNSTTVFVEDTQLAYTALESQVVWCSPPPKSCKPLVSRTTKHQRAETPSEKVAITEDGDIFYTSRSNSQSSYMRTPLLQRSSKRRRVERISGTPFRSEHSEKASTLIAQEGNVGLALISGSSTSDALNAGLNLLEESNVIQEATSQLPSSYSLSNTTPDSSKSRLHISPRSTSDPGSSSPNVRRPAIVSRSNTDPSALRSARAAFICSPHILTGNFATQKGSEQATRAATPDGQGTAPHMGDVMNISVSRTRKSQGQDELAGIGRMRVSIKMFESLPCLIRPPEPSASIDDFTTHVTPLLDRLAGLEVARAYMPVSVVRNLRVWERGHWLIDTASLETDVQIKFWQKLQEYVGTGSCGWGVWCTRDPPVVIPNTEPSLGIVRVFCWGEIVQHIYLLLYSVSMSKIRLLGVQWVDADDHVVVQMRGR